MKTYNHLIVHCRVLLLNFCFEIAGQRFFFQVTPAPALHLSGHGGAIGFVIHDDRLQLLFVEPLEDVVVAVEFGQAKQLPAQLVVVFWGRFRVELQPIGDLFVQVWIGRHQHVVRSVEFRVQRRHRRAAGGAICRHRRRVPWGARVFVLGVSRRVVHVVNPKFARLDSLPSY